MNFRIRVLLGETEKPLIHHFHLTMNLTKHKKRNLKMASFFFLALIHQTKFKSNPSLLADFSFVQTPINDEKEQD